MLLASYFWFRSVTCILWGEKPGVSSGKFLNIDDLLTLKQVREVYSRTNEQKYPEMALKTLNKLEI